MRCRRKHTQARCSRCQRSPPRPAAYRLQITYSSFMLGGRRERWSARPGCAVALNVGNGEERRPSSRKGCRAKRKPACAHTVVSASCRCVRSCAGISIMDLLFRIFCIVGLCSNLIHMGRRVLAFSTCRQTLQLGKAPLTPRTTTSVGGASQRFRKTRRSAHMRELIMP